MITSLYKGVRYPTHYPSNIDIDSDPVTITPTHPSFVTFSGNTLQRLTPTANDQGSFVISVVLNDGITADVLFTFKVLVKLIQFLQIL
jgi:hypothetical protein